MKRAATLSMGALPSYRYGSDPYDANKLGLGPMMVQRNGAVPEARWVGPIEHKVTRYYETSALTLAWPRVVSWSNSATSKIDWVFLADSSGAAATRRIGLWTYDRITADWAYRGYITLTMPASGNHSVRGIAVTCDKYTTGTVQVSGTSVTGTDTAWLTSGIPVGVRIGFGTTDPAQVSTWYEVAALSSDTGMTINTGVTLPAGTPYVIEDLRVAIATTNATTAANAGLFVVKGLRFELFTGAGTTIPAATTVDGVRAVYWLKSAATETFTAASSVACQARADWSTHYAWMATGTTTQQLGKFNLRAPLTGLSAGATTSAFVLSSAASTALAGGTIVQNSNGRVVTAGHGPGAGQSCYYFTTGPRIFRTKPLDQITQGDTLLIADMMLAQWPGGNANFGGSSVSSMLAIEYSEFLDMFTVANIPGTANNRTYFTKYKVDGTSFDRQTGVDSVHDMQSTASSSIYPLARYVAAGGCAHEAGMLYSINSVSSAAGGWLAALPIGTDWEYASQTGCRVLLPKMALTDCNRIEQVMAQESVIVTQLPDGSTGMSGYNLGLMTEPFRIYYRVAGIDDDSGAWTLLDQTGSLGTQESGEAIQLMLEFRAIGNTMAHCARVNNVGVIYTDNATDDHFAFDGTKSSAATKQFVFWHAAAFGSAVPPLRIRLYDADTLNLLVDDNTDTPSGTWEKTTDGTTWGPWNNADLTNSTTWVRYTPASIADNVKVRPGLTLK